MIIHELNFFKVYAKINKIEKNQMHIETNQECIEQNVKTIKGNVGRIQKLEVNFDELRSRREDT